MPGLGFVGLDDGRKATRGKPLTTAQNDGGGIGAVHPTAPRLTGPLF